MIRWGMTSEQELWACALHVEKLFGDDGPKHIAERIRALALGGDEVGVATWMSIAVRLDQIRDTEILH